MLNPLAMGRDFLRTRKAAAALLHTLKQHGRPGGIDVTRQDAEGAAALMFLLKHHPDLIVTKNRSNLTLMFKIDAERTFTPKAVEDLYKGRHAAFPDEDLVAQVTEKDPTNE